MVFFCCYIWIYWILWYNIHKCLLLCNYKNNILFNFRGKNEFFRELSEKAKLFAFVFLIIIIVFAYCPTLGFIPTILFSIILLIALVITKPIWLHENNGSHSIRNSSFAFMLAIVASLSAWNSFVESLLKGFINYANAKWSLDIPAPTNVAPIVIMIFSLLTIFIVNYFNRDTTVMGKHLTPIDKEFPEKSYKEKLNHFCSILECDPNKLDKETNWSAYNFTPLDAQVEILTNNTKKQKRIKELIPTIKSYKNSKTILVLGDPGGGKSVSLRKLCRDLLKEVNNTGKVPIYINLKEWKNSDVWSELNPPKATELYEFIVNNLKERLDDIVANKFIDQYFEKMYENGRIFFVFDSFDEISAVLDVDESSWLIKELSYLIYKFITGFKNSRGILASRLFRKPSGEFQCNCILEIRPFTEQKIREALKKSMDDLYTDEFQRLLFNEKEFLVPSARNPFTTALIASYAENNVNKLPNNQAELYSNYILNRLEDCREKIIKKS